MKIIFFFKSSMFLHVIILNTENNNKYFYYMVNKFYLIRMYLIYSCLPSGQAFLIKICVEVIYHSTVRNMSDPKCHNQLTSTIRTYSELGTLYLELFNR